MNIVIQEKGHLETNF